MNPNFNYVAPGFFETLGIPLVAGRDAGRDRRARSAAGGGGQRGLRPLLTSRTRTRSGGASACGRSATHEGYAIEIVGVVRDGKAASHARGAAPLRLRAVHPGRDDRQPHLLRALERGARLVRGAAARGGRGASTRRCRSPSLKTMEAQIGESLFVERMVAMLSAAFGLLATLLAAIGLYGVMSYAVTHAHPRDRPARGARRRPPRRADARAARGGGARRPRHRDRPARRLRPRQGRRVAALRPERPRPAHVRASRRSPWSRRPSSPA